jgi:hypothetical protein
MPCPLVTRSFPFLCRATERASVTERWGFFASLTKGELLEPLGIHAKRIRGLRPRQKDARGRFKTKEECKRETIKKDTNGIGTGRLMGHGLKVELFLLASGWFEGARQCWLVVEYLLRIRYAEDSEEIEREQRVE